jgi:formate transporter
VRLSKRCGTVKLAVMQEDHEGPVTRGMLYGFDAYSPEQIAQRVETIGVTKLRAPKLNIFMLGVLAGGFIGLGGLYYTFVTAGPLPMSPVMAGMVFAVGYQLSILAGAELFTSNNLQVMSWASRRVSSAELLRTWGLVLVANAVGAVGLGILFLLSGMPTDDGGVLARRAVEIAGQKIELPWHEAFFRGVMGNLFVCLAVWVSLAGRTVADKVLGTILPLSALAALGLEHVVASLYYLPRAWLMQWYLPDYAATVETAGVTLASMAYNFSAVALGNIVGGSLMVALVYYVIYRRGQTEQA